MKKKILIFVLFALSLQYTYSQTINGVAYYRSIIQDQTKVDSTKLSDPEYKLMMDMLKEKFIDDYKLEFDGEESEFSLLPALEKPDPSKDNGNSFSITLMGEDEILYKNMSEEVLINEKEFIGKRFLIVDELKKVNWVLEDENKMIGEYACFKATYMQENASGNKLDENNKKVIAWYTPQIPIKNGPKEYDGLPGLILEIIDNDLTFRCTKIVINPKERIKINKPSKGKMVNSQEFENIMKKKNEEIRENLNFKN